MCKHQKDVKQIEQPKFVKVRKHYIVKKSDKKLVQRDCNICGELTMCSSDLPWYGSLCKECKQMTD